MFSRCFIAWPLAVLGAAVGCASSPPPAPAKPPSTASATFQRWAPSKLDAERRAKFERLVPQLDKLFAEEQRANHLPGMGVGIVLGGEIVYAKGFGLRDVERKIPFDADTPFPIASVTKSFAAMTVLRLRDEGRLDLDVPAERYYPPIGRLARASRDAPPVTLRHLLTHSSGMPEDNTWADGIDHVTDPQLAGWLDGGATSRAPGVAYEYSNVGFGVVGRIIANVSGMPVREAIRRTVFEPLGMARTGWTASDFEKGAVAVGYRGRDGSEDMEGSREIAPLEDLGVLEAAGGGITTVRDLSRFVSFQVSAWPPRDDTESGPLRRSSVREMQQGMMTAGVAEFFGPLARRSPPPIAKLQGGHVKLGASAYGFGLIARRTCEDDFQIDHPGGLPGYVTHLTMLPQKGFGMVVFLNDERAPTQATERTMSMLREAGLLLPHRVEPMPALAAAPAAVGALMTNWDEPRARALFESTALRRPTIDFYKDRFARLTRDHGTCRADGEPQFVNRMRGRWRVACERGAITFAAGLAPGPSPRLQALQIREEFPPSTALARAGAACTDLLARWDERAATALFAKGTELAHIEKAFAQLSLVHGKCKLDRAVDGDGTSSATFSLTCADRPLELAVTLDKSGAVMSAVGRPPRSESAPNCAE